VNSTSVVFSNAELFTLVSAFARVAAENIEITKIPKTVKT
jgi:hypothetical protein